MTEALLAAEVRRAYDGDPWFGRAAVSLLSGIDAEAAFTRPSGMTHSIWQVVRHMATWAGYVAYRVAGGEPRDPDEPNWPDPVAPDATVWQRALEDLRASHDALLEALADATPEALDAVDDTTPLDGNGEAVTLRRAVEGVVQHDAYHLGQIAVIKQVLGVPTPVE